MKIAAAGRILFWRGGSLWIGLAGEPALRHSHHAFQVGVAFPGGGMQFRDGDGDWRSYPAALVLPNHPHAFEARGQHVAQIFVEPESSEGRQLYSRHGGAGVVALSSDALDVHAAALASAYERRAGDEVLIALARTTIASLSGAPAGAATLPDPRIARAIELIRPRLGDAIALGDIAAAVHLSPDRFRHLFMQETGVSFRAYLLWQRLERALVSYIAGTTLTEAAIASGFADSAHFSRTFRRMFGIAPASVRPE
jgi:AraC-like DNA-binding protein